MPDPTQEARQAVLAQYRKERGCERPFVAMSEVFRVAALDVAFYAESGVINETAVARFSAAKAYRTEIMERKKRQAERHGVAAYETFWHHGGRP